MALGQRLNEGFASGPKPFVPRYTPAVVTIETRLIT